MKFKVIDMHIPMKMNAAKKRFLRKQQHFIPKKIEEFTAFLTCN